MLTVAAVCVPGPGNYNEAHVARLYKMVKANLDERFWFVCITESDKPGWFAKIDLFKPKRFTGRVLYLDLDVTVVGDLAPLARFDAPFVIARDWLPIKRQDGSIVRSKFNSSVMSWDAGYADRIYTQFSAHRMDEFAGDQNWIEEVMPSAATFPLGEVVSYKVDVRPRGRVPGSARVVVYSGQPKPWEVEAP